MVSVIAKYSYAEVNVRKTSGTLATAGLFLLVAALLAAPPATSTASAREDDRLWVFFEDKGLTRAGEAAQLEALEATLPARTLARRAKVGAELNVNDLPVSPDYVSIVEATGAVVETRSRWLNAVSVVADPGQTAAIRSLPFVREVRPVAGGVKRAPVSDDAAEPQRTGARPEGGTPAVRSLDYGASFTQLDQIGIVALHDDGFDGTGVFICMLDTGFDTDHQCFRHLDLVAERDFINDDAETADEPGDPSGQDSHGTKTLSCVGAAFPGGIYGGSYNATFALAKTEKVDEEIQIEEDYWVEAVEWADSLGADIVSTSLGYLDWYTYEDMDGGTAVTTVAADMAAARGIVVVNSMGNEGAGAWRFMIAPADGDSVLSIGAVDSTGVRASFSSVGPTYDGRIKPDVMAQGLYVHVATTDDTSSYARSHGTSFSCPLTASAVGLLLQGHPEWGPIDVLDAMRSTASQSGSPDTLMGWGIADAYAAMYSEPLGIDGDLVGAGARLVWSHPNPFTHASRVSFAVPSPSRVTLKLYDVAGRLVRTLVDENMPAGSFGVSWDGTDAGGRRVASGVYLVRFAAGEAVSDSKVLFVK
ncbi:MAG: S8 family serine peptidase [Candidatus Eisenbacteria bacterium]